MVIYGTGDNNDNIGTANLRTKILDFRGFDSSIILILRGGILMSMGNSLESLSQAISAGRFEILSREIGRNTVFIAISHDPPAPWTAPIHPPSE